MFGLMVNHGGVLYHHSRTAWTATLARSICSVRRQLIRTPRCSHLPLIQAACSRTASLDWFHAAAPPQAQYRTPYCSPCWPQPVLCMSWFASLTSTRPLPPMLMTPLFHPPVRHHAAYTASAAHISFMLAPSQFCAPDAHQQRTAVHRAPHCFVSTFELVLTLTHSQLLTPWYSAC
jgi:hypothetical protein